MAVIVDRTGPQEDDADHVDVLVFSLLFSSAFRNIALGLADPR